MMPGMSGIDLLKIIHSRFPNVAIIMVTALDDRKTATQALEVGAYGYIIKPFERNEVLINVENALERHRLTQLSRQYEKALEEEVYDKVENALRQKDTLRLAESSYRDLFAGSRDAIVIVGRDGGIEEYNPAFQELFGYEPEEMAHLNISRIYADPSERSRFQKEVEEKGVCPRFRMENDP